MMIEAGTPISAIGDIAGMPPYWVVHSWRKESQEFDELITVASEAKAERIIAFRQKHGAFKRVADLRRVKGFGRKTLKKLEPFLDLKGETTLVAPSD